MTKSSTLTVERLLEEREWLRRLARRLVHDDAAAEDLAQDTLVRALENGGPSRVDIHSGADSRATLRGWLSTVVKRLSAEQYRKEARRRQREELAAQRDAYGDSHVDSWAAFDGGAISWPSATRRFGAT